MKADKLVIDILSRLAMANLNPVPRAMPVRNGLAGDSNGKPELSDKKNQAGHSPAWLV